MFFSLVIEKHIFHSIIITIPTFRWLWLVGRDEAGWFLSGADWDQAISLRSSIELCWVYIMTWCIGLLCLILNWGNFCKIFCCKADFYIVARRFYTMWDGKKWTECFPWQSGSAAGFGEQRKRNMRQTKENQTETFRWILFGWQKAMRSDFEFFKCCKAKSFKLKQLVH